ncbi:MAG: aminoglycoside phosphotransferase family protein [Deltaproteobacteria bacterium]|nr:aminoglycoside phosphotransferase family protein [Deltaproteobacteria bacterium]
MNSRYLGHLSDEDPLFWYLRYHIAPQLGFHALQTGYRVFQCVNSSDVYLYEEDQGRFRIVGKFSKPRPGRDPNMARIKAETEFRNLIFLRSLGFTTAPNYVVRPLGFNHDLDNLLLVEHLGGGSLSRVITDAIYNNQRQRLYRKLSALAEFLATLHNRTAGDWTVNFHEEMDYLGRLIHSLVEKRGLNPEHAGELWGLGSIWRSRNRMWEDRKVVVHGDATPSNFLFGRGRVVMAIDLERMKWGDRVFDIGRVCGELKHFFFRATGNVWAAEPFIGHFLWEYAGHFPDRESAFRSITRRLPFYMGLNLLRIARNSWVDGDYRWRLIQETKQLLRAK